MNIFRNLLGRVWQDPNAAEVVKISTGQLYLIRPGNIRSNRECIFNEAMATIRRVPSVEHHFQLVITRVYEEGDQELLEDEDETDEELVFLISEELEFRTGKTDDEPTFIWRDLEGDVDEFFEFLAVGTNEPTRAFFETCMYRAMYERKYRTSSDSIKDSELEQFIWRPPPSKKKVVPKKQQSISESSVKSQSKPDSSKPTTGKVKTVAAPLEISPAESAVELVSTEAELSLFDNNAQSFDFRGIVVAKIVQSSANPFEYYLTALIDDSRVMVHKISSDINARYDGKHHAMTWIYPDENGTQRGWLLRFASQSAFMSFETSIIQALWESLHQASWSKLKSDEQEYVRSATDQDVEMRDAEDEEEDEEEVFSELDPDEEDSDDEAEPPTALKSADRNSQLTVGYKGDRSFVVRGSDIGVFSHTVDNVEYCGTISKVTTPKGKQFKPKHAMLHDQDTKMILMHPNDPNSLYSMDIEVGKVVEEWQIHDDIAVDAIAPQSKFAQTTQEQTLVGVSHNALFRIDPRLSGSKLVDSQYKQYVSKNKFSGVTTTESGKLAVASEKGDIRLFDSIGKNAKTALPPLGDPILGIDVTANGRWIVATTKTYLLLIDTLIGEGRYQGSLGFDRSFPAYSKPMPRRLQLRNEHVAYMNHDISFSPARFNQGEGQEENAIVTSTGQFVIAWDFAKVKRGYLDKYEIKRYEDLVVQDNFKFGDDKQIIVALQNNVLAVSKKQLKRPTRTSLGAPHSRSNIVNAPY